MFVADSSCRSLISSAFAVVCSEVGDNTFYIAVILSMTNSKFDVFGGALIANAILHVLAVSLGYVATVIPQQIASSISSFLLIGYGLMVIRNGYFMSADKAQREYKEAARDIDRHQKGKYFGTQFISRYFSTAAVKSFFLTFICEWGDRSQISAVLMATHGEVGAVLLGGILGHALCLALATVGGSYLGHMVSVRAMTISGGLVFLLFGLTAVLGFSSDDD